MHTIINRQLIAVKKERKMDSISKKYGDYKYFSFLEEKDLDKLKDISIKKTYKKDEILFYKGDESKYLHLLVCIAQIFYSFQTQVYF